MDNQSQQPLTPPVGGQVPGFKVKPPVSNNKPEGIVQAAASQPGSINPLTAQPAQPTVIQSSLVTHAEETPNTQIDYHTQYSAYSKALLAFRKRVVITRILTVIVILLIAYLVYYYGFLHPTGIYNKLETRMQNVLSNV